MLPKCLAEYSFRNILPVEGASSEISAMINNILYNVYIYI